MSSFLTWWAHALSLWGALTTSTPRGPGPDGARLGASQARPVAAHLATAARHAEAAERTPGDPLDPPELHAQLLDVDVVRALDQHQAAFLGCFRRAQKDDPMLGRTEVRLHVHVDAGGAIDGVTIDGGTTALSACLARVARALSFEPPPRPLDADLRLIFPG